MYNHLGEVEPKDVKDGGKKGSPGTVEEDQCIEEGRYSVINMITDKISGMRASEDVG